MDYVGDCEHGWVCAAASEWARAATDKGRFGCLHTFVVQL